MRDLRETDIGDIERQIHNYRLFFAFLKKHNVYRLFRDKMFIDKGRTPYDLMKTITKDKPIYYGPITKSLANDIDKRWSSIFLFVPYYGGYWSDYMHVVVRRLSGFKGLAELSDKWKEFLYNNNYDKMRNSDDSTFTFD